MKLRSNCTQMVVHVPHASVVIPEKWRKLFYLDEESLRQELICMTDWYTDDLFGMTEGQASVEEAGRPTADFQYVRAPYSRLVCDMERFRDPAQEGMTANGMWICYEKTSDGRPLKRVDATHVTEILEVYDQHHTALTKACGSGHVLLIDAHSFPSEPLPYELKKQPSSPEYEDGSFEVRPDFCLGTDPVHTPPALAEGAKRFLEEKGYTVAFNTPFAGVLVPMVYYRKEPRVMALMIEVNRALYIDEKTAEKLPDLGDGRCGYERTKGVLQELLEKMGSFVL